MAERTVQWSVVEGDTNRHVSVGMQVLLDERVLRDGSLAAVVGVHTRLLRISGLVGIPQDGQTQGRGRIGVARVAQL